MNGNKYENGESNLPFKHAPKIVKRFGVRLDWLYKMPNSESDSTIPEGTQKFRVDIRDIISCKDNKIIIQIPDAFWQYFLERNAINAKVDTDYAKCNQIKDLNLEFVPYNNNIKWQKELEFDLKEFMSFISIDGNNISYYTEDNSEIPKELTKEQTEKASETLHMYSNEN